VTKDDRGNDSGHSAFVGAVVLGSIFGIGAFLALPLAAPAIAVGAGAVGISALSSTSISVGFVGLSAVIGVISGGVVGNKIASNAEQEQQQQQHQYQQQQERVQYQQSQPQRQQPPTPKFVLKLRDSNIKEYGFLGANQWYSEYSKALEAFNKGECKGEQGAVNNRGQRNANKFIIVDPAGDAFLGGDGVLSGAGASGALYKNFNTRPRGNEEEGVKVNAKNKITKIEAGYAVYNDIYNNTNSPYYGIIHAVGPKNKGELQEKLLTKCLKNVFIKYHHEASKAEEEGRDRPGLRIPAISGSIYRNVIYDENGIARLDTYGEIIKQSDDDYNAMLIRAIENGHNIACKELGEEIKFGHGLEICMYEQKMYNSMIAQIKNAEKKLSPDPAFSPSDSIRMGSSFGASSRS